MGKANSKGYLCDSIKNDDDITASKILGNHPEYLNEPLNDGKDTPGLILASTYGSNKIISLFLDVLIIFFLEIFYIFTILKNLNLFSRKIVTQMYLNQQIELLH